MALWKQMMAALGPVTQPLTHLTTNSSTLVTQASALPRIVLTNARNLPKLLPSLSTSVGKTRTSASEPSSLKTPQSTSTDSQPIKESNNPGNKKQQRQLWWLWNQAYTDRLSHDIQRHYQPQRQKYHKTRLPIVMCHGLFGFDKIGPDTVPMLQFHYWGGIIEVLRNQGCKVYIARVPSLGTIEDRAMHLDKFLKENLAGQDVNLVAHSMGGLDARFLLSHHPSQAYTIRSLTTISTPHRGSPVMDWFRDHVGLGQNVPQSKTSLLARLVAPLDAPAYSNLTTDYLTQHFNPSTPDNPQVKYFSYGANVSQVGPLSPVRFTWEIVKEKEGANDGIVSVHSSRWGDYLETLEADHFDLNKQRRLLIDFKRFMDLYAKLQVPAPQLSLNLNQIRTSYYGLQGVKLKSNKTPESSAVVDDVLEAEIQAINSMGDKSLPESTTSAQKVAAVEQYRERLLEKLNSIYGPQSFDDFVYGFDYATSSHERPQERNLNEIYPTGPSSLAAQQKTNPSDQEFDTITFYLRAMDRLYRQGF